jgi:hypothetical protein
MKPTLAFALTALLATPALATTYTNPESPNAATSVQIRANNQSPRLLVRIAKPVGEHAYLRIEDRYGYTIYNDRLGKAAPAWNRALQLQELPQGTYRLVVSDHRYRPVYEQTFQITIPVVPEPEPRVIIP